MNLNNIIAVRKTKTIYHEGDKVIKLFNSDYSKADVLNEALNQSRVEDTELNIPKILEVTKIDSKWAIVFEFIDGKTLEELMSENPDKIDQYLDLFVDLQIKVHTQKSPLLNKLKDKMNRKITEADLDATTRYELHQRLEAMPKHNKVCHGDFNPSNIIITKDNTSFIIDWSHATQGNASADAARTYLLFYLKGQEDIAKKYLELFCQKSDIARQYVNKWIPIVAASQLVKEKKDEKQFLLNWINVVEYE